ncbi:MAG TPA: hypothetical protein DHW49_04460 [Anaerolineae bacterium]|nr:hypothetical protein [Anaerolineae bacterium]
MTQDPNIAMTAAIQTAFAEISQPTQTLAPTETPVPTATVPRTPPALPSTFQTGLISIESPPRNYVADACQYIKNKWDSTKSAPGTVVMTIMYHGISKDESVSDPKNITVKDHKKLMESLHELGFQAINMQQMSDFIYDNARIPERSVLIIVDDRKYAENFNEHFRPYYDKWGWPVVNGWISAFGGADNVLAENVALSNEGWVDYQAHSVLHQIAITDSSTDEFITAEMQGSITNIQTYFNKTPIAFIWFGGNFSKRAVELGPQFGYKLGFTINPRGPVMYNWIPQADTYNASNPLAIPETPAGNPLMTLPRYWSSNAINELDTIRLIGQEAKAYAEQNKAIELEYYDIVCAQTYGAIP